VAMKVSVFWNIMLCNPVKSTDISEEHLQGLKSKVLLCLLFNLEDAATSSFEMLVDFHQTTQHYTPEDRTHVN
jgi:hypothetical protein